MGLQEVGAHVAEGGEAKEAGALQQALDILHADDDGAGVHEVQQQLHRLGLDAVNVHHIPPGLQHAVGEHGAQVGAVAGQDHLNNDKTWLSVMLILMYAFVVLVLFDCQVDFDVDNVQAASS